MKRLILHSLALIAVISSSAVNASTFRERVVKFSCSDGLDYAALVQTMSSGGGTPKVNAVTAFCYFETLDGFKNDSMALGSKGDAASEAKRKACEEKLPEVTPCLEELSRLNQDPRFKRDEGVYIKKLPLIQGR